MSLIEKEHGASAINALDQVEERTKRITLTKDGFETDDPACGGASSSEEKEDWVEYEGGAVRKKVLRVGNPATNQENGGYPTKGMTVGVAYVGTTEDGFEFDRSVQGYPFKFTLGQSNVISGWEIAIKNMVLSEEAEIWIRSDYGYGSQGTEGVPPDTNLIFTVELVSMSMSKNASSSKDAEDEVRTRLDELRKERQEAELKRKNSQLEAKKKKEEAQARLKEKLANKNSKGKKGGKKSKKGK
uniref:peptidylprolyl isomerase n=1 Tax=Mucochytrium quahogii TaxID=96639 RepID=A0A7S2S8N2_9STRA|mmetsp:Transcript_592/g.1012  ORF Transcript_592/g.1012 Transcript_592/m.1012 type:complete len:243 (+) Transcript_592:95-823(+)